MAQIVKFTGNNAELFCRESADNLKAKAQVIVPETHVVLLIKDGVVSEALAPGRHDIFDARSGLFGTKKDSDVSSVDFVFVSRTAKLPMLWGTRTPIKTRDPITDVPVSIGVHGELEVRVKTPKQFYLELVGCDGEYSISKLKTRVLSRLLSVVEPAIAKLMRENSICYTEFSENSAMIAKAIKPAVEEVFSSEYGLEVCSFSISGSIVPDSDIDAIERRRRELGAGTTKCPSCGANADGNANFCPECGNKIK